MAARSWQGSTRSQCDGRLACIRCGRLRSSMVLRGVARAQSVESLSYRTLAQGQDVTATSLCWDPGGKVEASNTNRHTRLLNWDRQLWQCIRSHCAQFQIFLSQHSGLQWNTQHMVASAQGVYSLHRNHPGFNFLLELHMPAGLLKHRNQRAAVCSEAALRLLGCER